MTVYTPPLREIRYVLEHVCDIEALAMLPGYEHADPETVFAALDEAARFMTDLVAPTNRIGDTVGATWEDGEVTTPEEFRKAWSQYVQSGWNAVSAPTEHGGHGFPKVVGFAISEMMTTANMALSLCPMLTSSAITLLQNHGSPQQQARYLEKLVSAEWTGTMVLSEPEAGSDLGALRAKAVPAGDGGWRISGNKIFITWGEHDMADNIIHMVLARVPDAPPGTSGISLFIVPKLLVDADGAVGERNRVSCVSVEEKLGIHGSPTCVLAFEDAVGEIVGEANQGMRYMFTMMNKARLDVGLEGVAIGERAYQLALQHARERLQGRPVGAAKTVTSPIIEHPDVRRMLMTMKASIEAMRGLLYDTAATIDVAGHHPDPEIRQQAHAKASLLTPIAKAWCSDLGVELSSIGIQIHGGMGYVEETGAAQFLRDSRIAPIYEGTNGIQAIDLVMRRLPMSSGSVVRDYLAAIHALDDALGEAGEAFHSMRVNLGQALAALTSATEWLLAQEEPNDALAGATPYLRMFGTVAGGYYLAKEALHAAEGLEADSDEWLAAKIATARFYAEQLLPQAGALKPPVTAGADSLYAVPPGLLGA